MGSAQLRLLRFPPTHSPAGPRARAVPTCARKANSSTLAGSLNWSRSWGVAPRTSW